MPKFLRLYLLNHCVLFLLTFSEKSPATVTLAELSVYTLPMNCSELLPDSGPFLEFLEAVGRGAAARDERFSKRIFRILLLREKMQEGGEKSVENPIDILIRKTLCFYREQKAPTRLIPFDEPDFQKFLRSSLGELEGKVDSAIFSFEFEKIKRREYEKKLQKNARLVELLQEEAAQEVNQTVKRLSRAAERKLKNR